MSSRALSYVGQPLKLLALWQPHAILCVAPDPENNGEPAKTHETRHWFPFEELPFHVAIHAAKKFDPVNRSFFSEPRFARALKRCGFYPGDPRPFVDRKLDPPGGLRVIPLGAIVGVATVVTVHCTSTPPQNAIDRGVRPIALHELTDDDRAFGYFVRQPDDPHPYRYAWRLANALLLEKPIPHSGRQEPLYPLDPSTLEMIDAQMRAMAT